MRFIALTLGITVTALVLMTTVWATARHRAHRYHDTTYRASALAEYSWLIVPWIILIAAAVPAVRGIAFSTH
jgi:heme/copper-type cytochrome/quinol oxidase subunit 2